MKNLTLYLLSFLLISCNNRSNQISSEFESLFKPEFSLNEPGGSVLIKKGDEIVFCKSFGLANMDTKEIITENTIFNTGSISKTFVSYGILILEQEQKLSIEDSIYQYFKDFTKPDIAKKIKIKHLLSHTSGLPDVRNVDKNFEFFLKAKDKGNFEPLKYIDSLNFEPGEMFEYSNPAFNALALIIENTSNQKWQQFIKSRIFEPSNMEDSKITDGPYPQEGVAHAYIRENGSFVEADYGEVPTFAAAGNGGIWCSVLDLAKYEDAIKESVFLDGEAISRSREVYIPKTWSDSISPKIGFSWFINDKKILPASYGVKTISHTGSQGGFRAFYISIPEKDILYICLFNYPVENLIDYARNGLELLSKNNWLD